MIYFEIQYEIFIYVYTLIRNYMHNISSNMGKNRDVTSNPEFDAKFESSHVAIILFS